MTDKIFQFCYTNIGAEEANGTTVTGWQPVAVSDGIPEEARKTCSAIQITNSALMNYAQTSSALQSSVLTDEKGNVLNLFELYGDGKYLYILRTQYGLNVRDVRGNVRKNMFSHAFIMEWEDNRMLHDPNYFLTLAKENFTQNIRDAKSQKKIVRMEPFNIESAMAISGLTKESYQSLLQCIFIQMSAKKEVSPLYIQYDGTEEQMRAILYCIYYELPYYMRKNVKCASSPVQGMSDKNIVFSINAKQYKNWFIPQTGENSVVSERDKRKLQRYGFIDYAVRNMEKIDREAYFSELENYAAQLGDLTASDELILKIAHQCYIGFEIEKIEAGELESKISDALRTKLPGSKTMDRYIMLLLDEINCRDMTLSDMNETNLIRRIENTESEDLKKTYKEYNLRCFSSLPIEQAADKLRRMDQRLFSDYRKSLSTFIQGVKILDYYYSKICLAENNCGWDTLNHILDESAILPEREGTIDRIEQLAWQFYSHAAEAGKDAESNYRNYITLMSRIHDRDENNKEIREIDRIAKEFYWDNITFESFSNKNSLEYEIMNCNCPRCTMFLDFVEIENSSDMDAETFLRKIWRFSSESSYYSLPETEKRAAISKICKIADSKDDHGDLSEWAKLFLTVKIQNAVSVEEFRWLMEIRKHLSNRQYRQLYEIFVSESDFEIRRIASELIFNICKKSESKEMPVILDIWLMIGKIRNPKCAYDIFDDVHAKILQYESEYIIKESRLFPELLDDAERYVRKHGSEEKNVKKLLNKYKKMKKKESSSMECTNGKIEGNVFTDRETNRSRKMRDDRVEDLEKKLMMRHISSFLSRGSQKGKDK